MFEYRPAVGMRDACGPGEESPVAIWSTAHSAHSRSAAAER
jgi:hypothetical protein